MKIKGNERKKWKYTETVETKREQKKMKERRAKETKTNGKLNEPRGKLNQTIGWAGNPTKTKANEMKSNTFEGNAGYRVFVTAVQRP